MDGENNGKPYVLMDDLGGKHPYFWFNTHLGAGKWMVDGHLIYTTKGG